MIQVGTAIGQALKLTYVAAMHAHIYVVLAWMVSSILAASASAATGNKYGRELALMRALARNASGKLKSRRHEVFHRFIKGTGKNDFATEMDHLIENEVVARLWQEFPRYEILAEESARVWTPPATETPTFILDPLDSTLDYINGHRGYAFSLGLVVEGKPVAGVVMHPESDTLYFGSEGFGAFLQRGDGAYARLAVGGTKTPSQARIVFSRFPSPRTDERYARLVRGLAVQKRPQLHGALSLNLSLIAANRRDVYAIFSPHTKYWDSAAADAILTQAGGRVSQLSGLPLDYRAIKPSHRGGVLATNGALHDAVVRWIVEHGLADVWPSASVEHAQ